MEYEFVCNLMGPQGNDGKDGKDGVDGAPGQTGPPGANGKDGPAATIRIGNVTTGEPGTPAAVNNTGTETNAVLDFTIPRGNPGIHPGPVHRMTWNCSAEGWPLALPKGLTRTVGTGKPFRRL